jgi:hypothetical protein
MRPRILRLTAAVFVWGATSALAQTKSLQTNASHDSVSLTPPGSTITRVYPVSNPTTDSVVVTPKIDLPAGWAVLTGAAPFTLGPGESDTWIVSLSIPAQATAGPYLVRLAAVRRGTSATVLSDSIPLTVTTRRGLSLTFGDRPMYVIAGSPYKLSLLVRNRGNALAVVRVKAASPGGELATVDPGYVSLKAGESKPVVVRVEPPNNEAASETDAVVEVTATDSENPDAPVTASARMTMAQPPGVTEPFATVPAQLRMRPVKTGSAGVAPIELTGGGTLREGGAEQIDFTLRGSPGRVSPFGEREEYRLDLRAPRYRARLGDNFFALSPLTSEGQAGFGGGLELTPGQFGLRGYSQRFRFEPGTPHETGFSASYDPGSLFYGSRFALNAVQRSGGNLAGTILGSSASLHPLPEMLVETEYASSAGSGRRGSAHSLRVSGNSWLRYDAAHVGGSGTFAGPTRGATDDYATLTRSVSDNLDLNLTGNSHRSGYLTDSVTSRQSSRSGTMGATWAHRLSLDYSGFSRRSEFAGSSIGEREELVRTRIAQPFAGGSFWASTDVGRSSSDTASRARSFTQLSGGASVSRGLNTFSGFAELYNGRSVSRGQAGSMTVGGSANVTLTGSLTLSVTGYGIHYAAGGAGGYSQFDGRLTQDLPRGHTISVRTRLSSLVGPAQQPGRIVYLEYGMPLRVPVGRLRSPGTVTGSVLDAESGSAVSGALVRLGSAAALSDADGRVLFRGLPTGEYRVAVAQPGSASDAIVTGDARVVIDSAHPRPAPFHVTVSRGASVQGRVVQRISAKTALGSEADSLEAPTALENVSVALIAAGDTIFRATDRAGKYSFTDVRGGEWTVAVLTEAPSQFHYDRESVALNLRPGESALADFQLLPRKRQIRILDDAEALPVPVPNTSRK